MDQMRFRANQLAILAADGIDAEAMVSEQSGNLVGVKASGIDDARRLHSFHDNI